MRLERLRKSLEFKVLAIIGSMLVAGVITAGIIAISIQKKTLYSITEFGTEKTARIIFENIETTMLEGKADVTKKIIENIAKSKDIQGVTVLDSSGKEAFRENSAVRELPIIEELKAGKERLLKREPRHLTFYLPLINKSACQGCHDKGKTLLGVVKVSVSIEKEYKRAMTLIAFVIFLTIVASLLLSLILWVLVRKMVIAPIKSIESAALRIKQGELSFDFESGSSDEIGRAAGILKDSFLTVEGVLQRIKELSDRIVAVVQEVEKESEKVLKGAESEAEATGSISASVEELNATATGISENTRDLAASAGDASASIEQMVSSIRNIDENIQELAKFVESTSASIQEFSATIREVASNTHELAGASEETVSAITEITAVIKEVEAGAKESALLSEKATNEAESLGMTSITKMITGMKEISASVQNTAQCINVLGSRY